MKASKHSGLNRRLTTPICFVLIVMLAGRASAELAFNLDFYPGDGDPDGIYEEAWPAARGDIVKADVYVSDVPSPGLISMGFIFSYDSSKIGAVAPTTDVDGANWPVSEVKFVEGNIQMIGYRELLSGLGGDDIRLGTVTLRVIETGVSELTLFDRPLTDDFVLDDEEGTVLDGDIPSGGTILGRIHPGFPGDVNGDGAVELTDAILAFRALLGIRAPFVSYTADMNGDGKIGIAEAVYVLQEVADLRQ